MTASNGPADTKRHAHADRSASAQLGRKAGDITDDLKELGEIAKEAVEEKLGQMRDGTADYLEQGKDKAQQVERSIEQYIRDRPLKSILIAAGVGLVVGRFWMRR